MSQKIRDFVMPTAALEIMLRRWNYCEKSKPSATHIYEWGDSIHLLYTSALAVWFGSLAAYFLADFKAAWSFDGKEFALGLIFLVSGFYSDCRKHIVEPRVYASARVDPENPPQ